MEYRTVVCRVHKGDHEKRPGNHPEPYTKPINLIVPEREHNKYKTDF